MLGNVVRVKRLDDGVVLQMGESAAKRLSFVDKNFVILENPIIEVVKLAPVEKKNAVVAESEPANIGNVPPSLAKENAVTMQTTEQVIVKTKKL